MLMNYAEKHHTNLLAPYKIFFVKNKSQVTCECFYANGLLWMFASKSSINKICKIHFRTLQIVHNPHDKLYQELVAVCNYLSIQ